MAGGHGLLAGAPDSSERRTRANKDCGPCTKLNLARAREDLAFCNSRTLSTRSRVISALVRRYFDMAKCCRALNSMGSPRTVQHTREMGRVTIAPPADSLLSKRSADGSSRPSSEAAPTLHHRRPSRCR
jgi:hypothetical protein